MNQDVAPVIAAQALLVHGMGDGVIFTYVQRAWNLDDIDARSALAAAHILVRREHGAETASSREP